MTQLIAHGLPAGALCAVIGGLLGAANGKHGKRAEPARWGAFAGAVAGVLLGVYVLNA